jgi:two-component system, NarL family, response regulator
VHSRKKTPDRIRVLIVDDHPIVLKGLIASIDAEADMEVAASARSGPEGVALFRNERPDVTIMDLNLTPQMTGIQAIEAIRHEFPHARIIVLSAYKGQEDIFRAIKAGALTYLLKETLADDLVTIIRKVHEGERPLPPEVGQQLAERVRQPDLSPREIEVLGLLARGLRNVDIANVLYITEDTTRDHVQRLFRKLKVKSRTAAVNVAIQRGLLRLD